MTSRLTTRARTLRHTMTDVEKRLWTALRGRRFTDWKFRRQEPIGGYIVDFVCIAARLIIELDGSQHIESPSDVTRDKWLSEHGYQVLRFWNYQVNENFNGVLDAVWQSLDERKDIARKYAGKPAHVRGVAPSSVASRHLLPGGEKEEPLARTVPQPLLPTGEKVAEGRMRGDIAGNASIPPWLTLIGLGEDGRAGLSVNALQALEDAEIVVGGQRHLDLVGATTAERWAWPSPMSDLYPAILAARGRSVVILASGDPFHHGVGSVLAGLIDPAEMTVFPAPSAFSLACARLGWAEQDCVTISLHGRAFERIVPHIRDGRRIIALSWDETTPAKLAEHLTATGWGPSPLVVLEAMGGPRECVAEMTAETFDLNDIDPLNVVALEIIPGPAPRRQPLGFGLADDLFEHDGQITKREIRALTLSSLGPQGGEVLWDIGGGSGSISIEWMLADPTNRAIAIEMDEARAARITRNALAFGVPALEVIVGKAPDALAGLPVPDAIFVGGGSSDPAILDAAWDALPSGGRIVVNAVTLEAEAEVMARYRTHGGDLLRLHVERVKPLGRMAGFEPARPVTQWRGVKP